MAHFAEIDENSVVVRVLVVPDSEEHRGQEFLADDLGLGGTWIQTSYNKNIRKNYAGIGMIYDSIRDVFMSPQPFDSWTLDEETCTWIPPVPHPAISAQYEWDEESQNWKAI